MESKIFGVLGLSILVLMMFMSLGSAVFDVSPKTLTFTPTQDSQQFIITNTNVSELLNVTIPSFTLNGIEFTFTGNGTDINESFPRTITVTPLTPIDFSDMDFREVFSGSFVIVNTNDDSENSTITVKIDNTNVCEDVEGNLRIDIKDITVVEGFGDDEEWLLLDEIEVEVEIENKNDDEKIKDIEVEWGLWSEETDEWVIELDDVDEFDLKEDSKETITINFKLDKKTLDVDLDELKDGDYTLYVRAIGEEQEDPEFNVCSSNSEPVQIVIEDDFVVLDDIQYPETVQCGEDVQVLADVWNIGDEDQEDVYVLVYNKALGILNEKITIGDIDKFEDAKLKFDFNFQVPLDAEEKWYSIEFTVYDEDNDVYENDFDDEESIFSVLIKVEGSCVVEVLASVSASLESEAKAGEELVVKVSVTNDGTKAVTYVLNAAGYTEWASAVELSRTTFTLAAGESEDVLFTFDVLKSVLGEKTFDVELLSEGQLVLTQPVSVSIEKSGWSITGWNIRENPYVWGIGLFNIILIVVIVIVEVRIARK